MVINKTAAKRAIDTVWRALESLSHNNIAVENLWRDLNITTKRCEKDHRQLMRGTWKENHPRAVTVETAARYFAAVAPFRKFNPPENWLEVARLREDWILGHALSELFTEYNYWLYLVSKDDLKKPIEILQALDYGEHLVR